MSSGDRAQSATERDKVDHSPVPPIGASGGHDGEP